MSCKIKFARNGKINKILDQNGNKSTLFQQIFNTPTLSLSESIEAYKNVYSAKVQKQVIGEKGASKVGEYQKLLDEAKKLDKEGKDFSSTGWFKTNEGQWKYMSNEYISQFKLKEDYKINTPQNFEDVIEDNIIFQAYPEVKDLKIVLYDNNYTNDNIGRGIGQSDGEYSMEDNIIYVSLDSRSGRNTEDNIRFELDAFSKRVGDTSIESGILDEIFIEPLLSFETPSGEIFNNYREALQATPDGSIKLQISDVTIAEISSNTDINTYEGTINHFVKSGVLTGERILDTNGDEIFVVQGETETAKQLTAGIIEEMAMKLLGQSAVKIMKTGNMKLANVLNKRTINGEEVSEKEVNEMQYEQLKDRFGEESALTIEVERDFIKSLQPSKIKKRIDDSAEIKTEDELITSIKSLLNKLGVKITSIEDYIKNDTLKNGNVPATSSALMDVVNKIMAFRDGTVTREDLIEETMHMIEASLDPQLTEGIRKNIHKTAEWKQYQEYYRDIYSREYSGDKLEEVLRREILGKVMANAVTTNFTLSENATLTEQSVFNRIKELLQQFFDKIEAYFKPEFQQQIDNLNNDIYTKLLSGELINELNADQNYGDKLRLYSASNDISNNMVKIQKKAEEAIALLEAQAYQISKNDASQKHMIRSTKESLAKVGEQFEILDEQTKTKEEKEIAEKIAEAELTSAYSFITNITQKQVKYLQRAVKKGTDNSYHFSAEEEAVYTTLTNQFDKLILPPLIRNLEEKSFKSRAEERILEEARKVSKSILDLKGDVGNLEKSSEDHLVELLARRLGLDDEKKKFVRTKLQEQQKETNWFFMNFGTLMHSSNIYLNSVGHVITRTKDEEVVGTMKQVQPFLEKLNKLKTLNTDLKGFAKNGFIENRFNDKAREEAILDKSFELYKEIVTDSALTKEEFTKKKNLKELTTAQRSTFEEALNEWQLENVSLSSLSPSEVKERRQRLAEYSQETQSYVSRTSMEYNAIMQDAEIVDGVQTFTKDMKYDFEQMKRVRQQDKEIFDSFGDLRKGITYNSQEEWEASKDEEGFETNIIKVSNGLYISLEKDSKSDATLAYELTKIDNQRAAEMEKKGEVDDTLSPKFKEILSKMDSGDAYDFLMLNSYIGYTSEYYDSSDKPSVLDKLKGLLNGEDDWRVENLIQDIAVVTKKINGILKANKEMNNPSEVSYDNMDKNSEVRMIKEYSEEREKYYEKANKLLKTTEETQIEEESLSETIPNKSFLKYMVDKHRVNRLVYNESTLDQDSADNINKIFIEIYNHTTTGGIAKITDLRNTIKAFGKGKGNKFNKLEKRVFSKTEEELGAMSEEEAYASMTNDLLQYSYTKLLPYFKKSQPTGVDIALNELEDGKISPVEFLDNYENGDYQYLKISPNYNFQKATEDSNRNPHFQQAKANNTPLFRTFEEGVKREDILNKTARQLYNEDKLNKFVNLEFLEKYNIDITHLFDTGEEIARANNTEFDTREAFVALQKSTLDNYNVSGYHNIYQLPQKEKGFFRKTEDVLSSGKGIKGIFDELVNFREDEADLGQTATGDSAKSLGVYSIPKYGVRKLSEGEASDEILESYIWMNKQSNQYKARNKNIGDMLAIKEVLLGANFEKDLNVQSTTVYKMFEEAMNYNFYGIKEVFSKDLREFGIRGDLGKMLRNFGSVIRFRNLAYTIISPITSLLTGSVQIRIESLVGEVVDKDAFSEANKFFMRTASESMRETMGFQGKSELTAIGSRWGFFELEERFANSSFGKGLRAFGKSPFVAHEMANFPVNPRAGLAVLADYKFVGEELIRFRNFKEQNKGRTEKELREEWKRYPSLLSVTKVNTDGVVGYDYSKVNTTRTEEEFNNYIDERATNIRGDVKNAIQRIDGQISTEDKAMASRNAIMSFIGIHRNWLFLATQNRLKRHQLSTVTGEYEEGSWVSAFKLVSEIYKDVKSGKAYKMIDYLAEKWNSKDEVTRQNVKRTFIELGVLHAMIGLTLLAMKEMDDKDPDSYLFKLSSLFLFRTTSEIASSTVGLPKNLFDTLGDAVVGLNTLDLAFNVTDFASSKIVNKGRYKGMTERERYVYRHLPIFREYNSLGNIDETIKSYLYFNLTKGKALDYGTAYPFLKGYADNK